MMVDLDISIVNWMDGIWLFRWWRKVDNSASPPPQIIRMSSMNLSHLIGGGALPGVQGLLLQGCHKDVGQVWGTLCPHSYSFFLSV